MSNKKRWKLFMNLIENISDYLEEMKHCNLDYNELVLSFDELTEIKQLIEKEVKRIEKKEYNKI